MFEFQFNLGDEVKDRITGFSGIIISRTQWLTNCNTYGLKSQQLDKDGKPQEMQCFDEPNIVLLTAQKYEERNPVEKTGGPTPAVRPTNR